MFKYKGLEGNDAWKLYMSEGKKGTPTPGDQTFGSLLDEAQAQASGPPLPEEPLAPEVPLPPPEAPAVTKPKGSDPAGQPVQAGMSALGAAGGAAAAVAGGLAIANAARKAATPVGSISQYMIGSGGQASEQADNAIPQAMLAALNRVSGLRSRM